MNVLALDLGTVTGWAVLVDGQVRSFGEKEFVGDKPERFIGFDNFLGQLLYDHEIDWVVFEEVNFNRGFSYIPGMMALLWVTCINRDLGFVGVNVSSLKAWATGSGSASKEDMIEVANGHLGADQQLTDNMADAILAGLWFFDQCAPDRDRQEDEPEFSGY